MQSLEELQSYMKAKFNSICLPEADVKIAFRLPQGTKIDYCFIGHGTVKVSTNIHTHTNIQQ